MRSVTERFSRNRRVDVAGHHALGQVRWNRRDIAIGRQHDRRILAADFLIGAHQVRHVAGELVTRHVIDQQRDGAQSVAQPERAVRGELPAADHLLEAEHGACGDPREQRLATARATDTAPRRPGRPTDRSPPEPPPGAGAAQRARHTARPGTPSTPRSAPARIAKERAEALQVVDYDARITSDVLGRDRFIRPQPHRPSRLTCPVSKSISARGMRSSVASASGRA